MKKTCILAAALALLMLSACGATPAKKPVPTPVPEIELSAGSVQLNVNELSFPAVEEDFALLENFTDLTKLDLSGSECLDSIIAYRDAHPEVEVIYTVTLPDGSEVSCGTRELMLENADYAAVKEYEALFPYLPELETLHLGEIHEDRAFTMENAAELQSRNPALRLDLGFELYGRAFRSTDEKIDLRRVPVEDNGEAVMTALRIMPDCTYLDMDNCGVADEDMAVIRDAFPEVKVVWRVWFGDNYSVRTDVEKILASKPSMGGNLFPSNTGSLKYCTDVKYLDVGHNMQLDDISFVAYMPKLEVAIVAMAGVRDASPLANCTNLEYLEIQTNLELTDLTPLAGLTNLKHLNIGYLPLCTDMSPIFALTGLERLMIGCVSPIPDEQIEEYRRLNPDCEVDDFSFDPTAGTWRYMDYDDATWSTILAPRYELLCEQFGYEREEYAFYWNDPLYFAD